MTDVELYDTLKNLQLKPRRNGGQWMSLCPAHEDRTPSLSAGVKDGRLLLHCFAGCPFMVVLNALGLRGSERTHAPPVPVKPSVSEPSPWMLAEWKKIQACGSSVESKERELGIPLGGLARIGAVWSVSIGALAAPMYANPCHDPIGVRLRADDGRKWAVPGSHNGLFVPSSFVGYGPVFMPEGMTDTAALCGLGLDAVGRPSCNGGRELAKTFAKMAARPVIVVSDRDEPGILGAQALAMEISKEGIRACMMKPMSGKKDVREWIACGATRQLIEYAAKQRMCI